MITDTGPETARQAGGPPAPTIPDARQTPTLTVPEAGAILGLSRPSAYEAAARGEIPILRFGRRLVVPTARFLAMLGLGGPDDHAAEPAPVDEEPCR